MKIAISTKDSNIEGTVDPKFGRAQGFLIYDTDSSQTSYLDNSENAVAPQGAGTKTAQMLLNLDVETLISGHLGPKAFKVLDKAGINIYNSAPVSIKQALDNLSVGMLREQDC